MFDHVGSLKKYESALDILKDFFELRMKYYVLRKDWLTGMLDAESSKLNNQARFILEKIQGTVVIGKGLCFGYKPIVLFLVLQPLNALVIQYSND